MLSALALRTDPKSRETFYSFVGRLAAVNGVSLQDFLNDFGLPKNGFFALHGDVVKAIAQLADLDPLQIGEMSSWTGLHLEGVRMAYRGEQIVSRAIRNPDVRGCPDCLREDANGSSESTNAMAMRGHWLLRHSRVCLIHDKLLVPLWSVTRPALRDDIQARLAEIALSIEEGAITATAVIPSAFDRWLDHRLETMADDSWLGGHPLHVVATMCDLIGKMVAQNNDDADQVTKDIRLHRSYAEGFDYMMRGQAAVETLIDRQISDRGPTDGPQKVFQPLYRKLGEILTYDPGFDYFRDLLRERVLDTWPIAAGETVLGTKLPKRRLHSVSSLSQETGEDSGTLRRRLAAKRIIEPEDNRPDAQITFPSATYDRLANEITDLVFLADVREAMGASEAQFDGLVAGGMIKPRIAGSDLRRVWVLDDGLAILDRLQAVATLIVPGSADWVHIQDAARKFRAPLSDIFAGIAEGRLKAGKTSDRDGYGGIHVRETEIAALFRHPQRVGQAPSAFGVSIGVKTGGAIQMLINQGFMTVTELVDARTGAVHQRILDENAASFHARFVSWCTAAVETGISSHKLQGIFRARGVAPFVTPHGPVAGVFDRRAALAAVRADQRDGNELL